MTESETINTLSYLLGYENAVDKGELEGENHLNSQEKEALQFILEEIQAYRAIGTVEEFKALKEKNEPKKPYLDQKGLLGVKMLYCSVCNKEVISDWNKDLLNNYCHNCGQKIDWKGGATDESTGSD